MFKVGQKVICKQYGEGVVYSVNEDRIYPVIMKFNSGVWDSYTEEGKLYEDDDEPSLSVIKE